MAERIPTFTLEFNDSAGILVPGPEAVAWIHDTDDGIDFKFFALPGPQTLQEVEDWEMAYGQTEEDRRVRAKFTEIGDGAVWTGYSEKDQRQHSKYLSGGIGRKVRFQISGKPKGHIVTEEEAAYGGW